MKTVAVPGCLCCSCVGDRWALLLSSLRTALLYPNRRWKEPSAAGPSSLHRKVGHDNICLQRESFRFSLPLAALNIFTRESMPKVFLSSDQMFLFHLETFQSFHPYSIFHCIFQFLNCFEKKKWTFIMSIISKVKGLGIKRSGSLQQFLTFFNTEEGGTLPFIEIYCQHSFCLLQSLTRWAT